MPVMAVTLDRVADVTGPPELKIETVEGAESLTEWVRAYSPSFGVGPELIEGAVRVEAGRGEISRIVRLAARLEGRTVGTALMLDAHGVAGIYVVATAEGYRRRGIGAVLTAAALEAGRQRGLHIGTLQASGLGEPVYARMGFEKVAEYQLFQPPAQ
jgi:GNAT superfamily N-acetyltransferase